CFGFLLLAASLLPSAWFSRFLSGLVAPSAALAAFAVYVVGSNQGMWPLVKVPLTLTMLFAASLWRLGARSLMEGLQKQREVAKSLGASETAIWSQILLPQLAPPISTLSGLAAIW